MKNVTPQIKEQVENQVFWQVEQQVDNVDLKTSELPLHALIWDPICDQIKWDVWYLILNFNHSHNESLQQEEQ